MLKDNKKETDRKDFFEQIEHIEVSLAGHKIFIPVFYYDVTTLSVQFLASIEKVKKILPSPRMYPLRITPWHCVVSLSAFEYRDSDVGAYNELSIGVPVSLERPLPLFVGTLRKIPTVPNIYVRHLPVTTEIACSAGVKLAGYPKFKAQINFEKEQKWVKCELSTPEQHILTLRGKVRGKKSVLKRASRSRAYPITLRDGYMLRSELIFSKREIVSGRGSSDFSLELGSHPIAQELKELNLSKILAYEYAPKHQAILMPPAESYSV